MFSFVQKLQSIFVFRKCKKEGNHMSIAIRVYSEARRPGYDCFTQTKHAAL